MEYYSTARKKEILPFVTKWMNLEGIMLSEITQIEKDEYCRISLTYGINLKKKSSSYKQGVEQWLPGTGEMFVKDYKGAVMQDEKAQRANVQER